jgi:mono/diheme cytochrome c family protein
MKKFLIVTGFFALGLGLISCGGAKGDDPGSAYMPDMYYSRAYETYGYNNVGGEYDSLLRRGIRYNGMPVPGTVARGEALSYHLTNDSAGLLAADALKNPIDSGLMTPAGLKEAERLYLIHCGICHGTGLDGNGPIAVSGAYPAVPKNLMAADSKAFTDGHYFHVITYGIRTMGSYASQLSPDQRWWVIKYIRSKQGGKTAAAKTDSTAASVPAADSVAKPAATQTN